MTEDPKVISQLPIQSLAYIGDAVYELYVREVILEQHPAKPGRLHGLSIQFAKARFQAKAAVWLMDRLDEHEKNILLRGRNADPGAMAKHATPQEYRWASGLESLIGYLYLSGQKERLQEILKLIMEVGTTDETGSQN